MSDNPQITLQPMVHVADMASAVAFFEALGARVQHGSRDGDFVVLDVAGQQLSLLGHPPNPEQREGQVELNFEVASDLEVVEQRAGDAGVRVVAPTAETGFGRQLQLEGPDGLLVKVNELDRSRYA